MWNITFCCRGAKVGKDGLAPVEMVITVDGVRSYRRLSIKVNPLEYKKLISSKRDNYVKRYCENERLNRYYFVIIVLNVVSLEQLPSNADITRQYQNICSDSMLSRVTHHILNLRP